MCHPPTPPAIEPTTDCEEWQTTDDYGTAWRNPLFRPPVSADEAEDAHGPALTRDGFTEALLRRDGGR